MDRKERSYVQMMRDIWGRYSKLKDVAEKLQVNLRNALKLEPGLGVNGVKELAEGDLEKKLGPWPAD